MSLITWNDSFSVGVKTIDQQHAGLFAIVNELHAAMMKGHAQSVVGPLLDKLVKYTPQHFAYEERMMDATCTRASLPITPTTPISPGR